ncbi:MAG: hypothetical protein ACLRX5_10090 [Slackia sp.]
MAKGGYIAAPGRARSARGLGGSAIGAKLAMLTPDNVSRCCLSWPCLVAFAVLRKRAVDVPEDVSISPRKQYAIVTAVPF